MCFPIPHAPEVLCRSAGNQALLKVLRLGGLVHRHLHEGNDPSLLVANLGTGFLNQTLQNIALRCLLAGEIREDGKVQR